MPSSKASTSETLSCISKRRCWRKCNRRQDVMRSTTPRSVWLAGCCRREIALIVTGSHSHKSSSHKCSGCDERLLQCSPPCFREKGSSAIAEAMSRSLIETVSNKRHVNVTASSGSALIKPCRRRYIVNQVLRRRHQPYRQMIDRGFRTFLEGVAMLRPNETAHNRADCFRRVELMTAVIGDGAAEQRRTKIDHKRLIFNLSANCRRANTSGK